MVTRLVHRAPVSRIPVLPLLGLCVLVCLALGACGGETPPPPGPNPPTPTPTPEPPTGPARLSVTSSPSGAGVYIGAKSVGGVVRFETGRFVGNTPLTVDLSASDVSRNEGDGFSNLHVQLKKKGYRESIKTIGLGRDGNLTPGKTYEVDLRLTLLQ